MEHKISKIKLSQAEALQKMRNWCAYQERSQHETRSKLLGMYLNTDDSEEIIAQLITENYLNEERFAMAFVSGKFRIKHWGKNKIKAELRKHQVSERLVQQALHSIDMDEYLFTLQKVIAKRKAHSSKAKEHELFFDLLKFCISRGFESDLVNEHLKGKN